jgi:hypothetical protein
MNPYQLIALKARQATKEREAKRKARLLERSNQSSGSGSGSGSSGVISSSSGESSLGSGSESFPKERSQWDRVQPKSTPISPSILSTPTSTVGSGKNQPSSGSRNMQSVPSSLTTINNTQASLERASQGSNGPVLPPITNTINEINHDIQMEEEDDDADLKRLMNQAQAMLKITDNLSQPENRLTGRVNESRAPNDETQLDRGKVASTSVSADPNDERR